MFLKYPKIHRLGKDETEGILFGTCVIQEKVDGANASIWLQDGEIRCGSRNNDLIEKGNPFNGFVDWARNSTAVHEFFLRYPQARLYGEWLVPHTIRYDDLAYKQFYLFDIHDENGFWDQKEVMRVAQECGFQCPSVFAKLENPSPDEISQHVGKSELGPKGEGVVIKNMAFKNKFGEHCYAKMVCSSFKEDNAITFGGNDKHSGSYWEVYVMQKYMTVARVQKVIQKLGSEIGTVSIEHTARVINTCYHDLITEEIWEIQKKVQRLDFKHLQILCSRKAASIFHGILDNKISVGHEE